MGIRIDQAGAVRGDVVEEGGDAGGVAVDEAREFMAAVVEAMGRGDNQKRARAKSLRLKQGIQKKRRADEGSARSGGPQDALEIEEDGDGVGVGGGCHDGQFKWTG